MFLGKLLDVFETIAPSSDAGIVTAAATLLTAFGVLFGGLAVFVPAMRRLNAKMETVHKQVTENGHTSPGSPTLLDRLDDLSLQVKALSRVMDTHMAWSDLITEKLELEIAILKGEET